MLLVEDEPSAAMMLAKGLREESYAVDVAADGERALELAFVNDYDLVILDVMLPRKGGFEVCRELRAGGSAIPVLMLTARDAVEDRVAGLDSGPTTTCRSLSTSRSCTRVRALLRRRPALYPEVINVADLSTDTRARRARRRGRDLELTAKEYPGTDGVLFADGGRTDEVFWMRLGGLPSGFISRRLSTRLLT